MRIVQPLHGVWRCSKKKMFHLSLASHVYCRVCYPFLWESVTPGFSKHSQTNGVAQELQGACPCCGVAALENTLRLGGWRIIWMMCCDPWLLVQTRACSCQLWSGQFPVCAVAGTSRLVPQLGTGTKSWLTDVLQSNSRCVHGCWLNPDCFWTVSGAQFVKPQG